MSSESVVYRAVPIQEEEPESANVYGLSNNTASAAAVQTRQSQRPSIVARCLLISGLALSMLLVLSAVHSSRQFGKYTRRDSLFHDGHGWMHHHNHHPHGGGHYDHGGYHGKPHHSWNHEEENHENHRHDQEESHGHFGGHHHHGHHHHDHNSHSRDEEEQVQPQAHSYYADEQVQESAQESLPHVPITVVDTFELEKEQETVVRIAPIVEEDLALVNPLP